MATEKKFDAIRLKEETIRNMQRKGAPKKPQLKNPPGGTKGGPPRTPQLKPSTKRPMNPLVIKDRRNKLKKPRLRDETLTPMSTDAIQSRREKLKKPKLKDETLSPMSTDVIQNRREKLKKPKLKNETLTPMSTDAIENRKNQLKKPNLKDETRTPMSTDAIKNRKNQLKKPKLNNSAKGQKKIPKGKTPQLKPGTKKPMNPLVIKDRKNKIKKPKLDSKTTNKAKSKSEQKYPVAGFLFKVEVDGFNSEASFKEVSGLSMEREVETIVEGGNNDFVHKVPKGATKYNNLVLKRGLMAADSAFAKWCIENLQSIFSTVLKPKTINLELQDTFDAKPVMKWSFTNAWPVKWEVSGFDSQKSEIVIESIEFAYQRFAVS